jgi:predicted amidohydrolase
MNIAVAQIRPFKGDIKKNIETHKKFIALAVSSGARIVVFPELSLTGYEPELSKKLATDQDDSRFDDFQKISDTNKITIGAGVPTKGNSGIYISMIIFQPHQPRQTYSKQYLHEDEHPYFICREQQVFLSVNKLKIAPAICYESLLPQHSEYAFKNEANIYIASVAKSANGVQKALKHFPEIARKYSMTVLMANSVGPCDNFESAGNTSVWNNKGVRAGQLNDTDEGLLIIDTETGDLIEKPV